MSDDLDLFRYAAREIKNGVSDSPSIREAARTHSDSRYVINSDFPTITMVRRRHGTLSTDLLRTGRDEHSRGEVDDNQRRRFKSLTL